MNEFNTILIGINANKLTHIDRETKTKTQKYYIMILCILTVYLKNYVLSRDKKCKTKYGQTIRETKIYY